MSVPLTYFARSLQSYYRRLGSKIIFINGQTLSECALSVFDKEQRSFDAAMLSRIIRGKRLPTVVQVHILSDVLKLSSQEKDVCMRALARDVLDRYAVGEAILRKKQAYTRFLEYTLERNFTHIGSIQNLRQHVQHHTYRIVQKVLRDVDPKHRVLFGMYIPKGKRVKEKGYVFY